MSKKRKIWRGLFLGTTALAVGMELFASYDGDAETDPWTAMIVQYIPDEVTALAIAGLSGWLAVHFFKRYKNKKESNGA